MVCIRKDNLDKKKQHGRFHNLHYKHLHYEHYVDNYEQKILIIWPQILTLCS